MRTSSRSRLVSLLIFILTFTLIIGAMSVSVFAHDGDDHEEETSWFDTLAGQIVGFCLAGVIFVACVVFIIWWIPKKNEGKEKKAAKK